LAIFGLQKRFSFDERRHFRTTCLRVCDKVSAIFLGRSLGHGFAVGFACSTALRRSTYPIPPSGGKCWLSLASKSDFLLTKDVIFGQPALEYVTKPQPFFSVARRGTASLSDLHAALRCVAALIPFRRQAGNFGYLWPPKVIFFRQQRPFS